MIIQVAELLMMNLRMVAEDLETGAIVVLDDDRIRVRRVPMRPVDRSAGGADAAEPSPANVQVNSSAPSPAMPAAASGWYGFVRVGPPTRNIPTRAETRPGTGTVRLWV